MWEWGYVGAIYRLFPGSVSADFHLGLANERRRQEITGRAKVKSQGISLPSLSLCLSLSQGSILNG